MLGFSPEKIEKQTRFWDSDVTCLVCGRWPFIGKHQKENVLLTFDLREAGNEELQEEINHIKNRFTAIGIEILPCLDTITVVLESSTILKVLKNKKTLLQRIKESQPQQPTRLAPSYYQ